MRGSSNRFCPNCGSLLETRTNGIYSCEDPVCDVYGVSYSQRKPLGSHIKKIVYVAVPRVVIT